jgi:glycosyltransferase involved in cell wall biosynthesis
MRILLIHNFYQQPGGEDRVFDSEKALLSARNHEVFEFSKHNDEIRQYTPLQKIALMGKTTLNAGVQKELLEVVKNRKPDVLHFHNTFPLISPAVYNVGKALNIPVVQTIHNYRFFCANGLFYRDNRVCEECFGKRFPLPGILHACYRNSRLQTFPVAGMQAYHHQQKTWQKKVDAFIALTEFGKQKLLQARIPAEKVFVKPHFIDPDPGYSREPREYALFVGRLSEEKGVETLLKSWQFSAKIPLKIIGDGPLLEKLRHDAAEMKIKEVDFLGRKPLEEVNRAIQKALFLIVPSECYETFGLVAAQAFACGTPVIASRLGAMGEIVEDGKTGLHFISGDVEDLAAKVEWAWAHSGEMTKMGGEARREYEKKYTAEINYEMLIEIYHSALVAKR